jgi:UDP:flavonoid glycosyltransferase YjiC (YdhE family)
MRVLIYPHALPSHVYPMTPLLWALRLAGHEVLACCPPNVLHVLHNVGVDTVPLASDFDPMALAAATLPTGLLPIEVWGATDDERWRSTAPLTIERGHKVVAESLDIARTWRPDLIVTDPLEVAGRVVAGRLGVPCVRHRWGIDPITDVFDPEVDRLLADVGLDDVPQPVATTDVCPPSLQVPGIPSALALQYVPFNGTGTVPEWAMRKTAPRRLCVTLGTALPEFRGAQVLLRRVLRAAAQIDDLEVVIAAATVDPALLDEFGDMVVGAGRAPLTSVLGSCDAVVHHGGSGGTITTTRFGLPHVVTPQWGDQFACAKRIRALGVGVALDTAAQQRNQDAINAAVRTVVEDDAPRVAARRLAEEAAALPTPAQVVTQLAELVETAR